MNAERERDEPNVEDVIVHEELEEDLRGETREVDPDVVIALRELKRVRRAKRRKQQCR